MMLYVSIITNNTTWKPVEKMIATDEQSLIHLYQGGVRGR